MSCRAKRGATESWFRRRRGGQQECDKKDNGWRNAEKPEGRSRGRREGPQPQPQDAIGGQEPKVEQVRKDLDPEATLLVPYTLDSDAQEAGTDSRG